MIEMVAMFPTLGVRFGGLINVTSMATDYNRNMVVKTFLESKADYIFWIDADTVPPKGGLKRLLENQKDLVSGLYYKRKHPYEPIAYYRNEDGEYNPIAGWKPGEILPVDSAGMGCLLAHRSVYENIQKNYTVLQRADGGFFPIRKDKIKGSIKRKRKNSDGEIRDGLMQMRVWQPERDVLFPHYALEYGRTEDMFFFETAKDVGHQLWLDTGVECSHIASREATNKDYIRSTLIETLGGKLPVEVLHVE